MNPQDRSSRTRDSTLFVNQFREQRGGRPEFKPIMNISGLEGLSPVIKVRRVHLFHHFLERVSNSQCRIGLQMT